MGHPKTAFHPVACVVLGVSIFSRADADESQSVDAKLLAAATRMVAACRENDLNAIGVMSFSAGRVAEGALSKPARIEPVDAELGYRMARRFEVALALRVDVNDPIHIVDLSNSPVEAESPDAARRAAKERLLQAFPCFWGQKKMSPDAVIAGEVLLSAEMRRLRCSLHFVTKDDAVSVPPIEFETEVTAEHLTRAGYSFRTRGALDGQYEVHGASKSTERSVQGALHPLVDPASPVRIRVFRNGDALPYEIGGNVASITEPQPKDELRFLITKSKREDSRGYAVVLKINGVNTLFGEVLPDDECSKWVLGAKQDSLEISGFQLDRQKSRQYRVLPGSLAAFDRFQFGEDAGKISVSVYAEAGDERNEPRFTPPGSRRAAIDLALMKTAVLPPTRPMSLDTMKFEMSKSSKNQSRSRGLIVAGSEVRNLIKEVDINVRSTPVLSVTIVYSKQQEASLPIAE